MIITNIINFKHPKIEDTINTFEIISIEIYLINVKKEH